MSQKDRMKEMVQDLARQGMTWSGINQEVKDSFGKSYRKTDMLKDIAAARGVEQKPYEARQKNVPKKLVKKRQEEAAKAKAKQLDRKYEPMKGRIQYRPVDRAFENWIGDFNYEVSYFVKNKKTGEVEEKVIIIASDDPMTKREIYAAAIDILESDDLEDQYGAVLIRSSLQVIGAYKRGLYTK